MSLEAFKNVPKSALTEVTPANPVTPVIPAAGGTTVDEFTALSGADHTKISTLQLDNAPGQNNGSLQPPGSSVNLGSMIDAKLFIELMDSLVPALLVAALYSANIKMRKSELQLTEAEKKTLAPIFQECLKTIHLNFNNPWIMLGVTLGVIYGSKITEKGLVAYIDKKNEEKEQQHENVIITAPGASAITGNTPNAPVSTNNPSTLQRAPLTPADRQALLIEQIFMAKNIQPVKLDISDALIKKHVKRMNKGRREAITWIVNQFIKNGKLPN